MHVPDPPGQLTPTGGVASETVKSGRCGISFLSDGRQSRVAPKVTRRCAPNWLKTKTRLVIVF